MNWSYMCCCYYKDSHTCFIQSKHSVFDQYLFMFGKNEYSSSDTIEPVDIMEGS